MPVVIVTTTYLEIPDRAAFRPALRAEPCAQVIEAEEPLPDFYRFLYGTVGRAYSWTDRLSWSDERLYAHLARPGVTLLVLYVLGTPAGYIELDRDAHEPGTEVAYFGLFQAFHGRGLGKYLLSVGVARAFAEGAGRVWVHTCSLDGPHALANYQARGFAPYKTTTHEQSVP
ncbi:MAG: GNAT family N-acetyltransferase [Chloroflexales bacterium]|nr:GNAT family N-acetyltransferase [Chloroflexales bacterium]